MILSLTNSAAIFFQQYGKMGGRKGDMTRLPGDVGNLVARIVTLNDAGVQAGSITDHKR